MRRPDRYTEALFSTVRLAEFVPSSHLLRPIRIRFKPLDGGRCILLG